MGGQKLTVTSDTVDDSATASLWRPSDSSSLSSAVVLVVLDYYCRLIVTHTHTHTLCLHIYILIQSDGIAKLNCIIPDCDTVVISDQPLCVCLWRIYMAWISRLWGVIAYARCSLTSPASNSMCEYVSRPCRSSIRPPSPVRWALIHHVMRNLVAALYFPLTTHTHIRCVVGIYPASI